MDIDVVDSVELGSSLPVVLVRGEGPFLIGNDARYVERTVPDVVLRRLPPVLRIGLYNLRLDRIENPQVADCVVVRRRIIQINLQCEIVGSSNAQGGLGRFMVLRGVLDR